MSDFLSETEIQAKLCHPNILSVRGIVIEDAPYVDGDAEGEEYVLFHGVLMEYVPHGSLGKVSVGPSMHICAAHFVVTARQHLAYMFTAA